MDKQIATSFLRDVFSRCPENHWISVFAIDRAADQSSRQARKVLWARVGEIEDLVERLEPLSPTHCIWYGLATRRAIPEQGRGGAEDCALVPAMWADLDVTGPGHHVTNLPPTEEAAQELLHDFLSTSMTVKTGGGLQPYWLLDEPLPAELALPLLDRWYYTWQQRLGQKGWHCDAVFDLPRILRVPGTFNCKELAENPEAIPRPVTWNGPAVASYSVQELYEVSEERPKVVAAPVLPPYEGLERAGDHFKRVHTVESVLELLGFHSPEVDSQGTHWVRPRKEPGAGTSATVFKDAPDKVTIWSSTCTQMWPALEVNKPYDAFSLLAVTNYGGDFSRAAEFLRTKGYGYEEEERNSNRLLDDLKAFVALQGERLEQEQDDGIQGTGWRRIRLSLERYKTPPPPPDIFQRADETCLLYRRRIHYFYGPPESGKSWGAQVATAWAILEGKEVVYIDFENDPWSFRERMKSLGVTDDETMDLVAYFNPSGRYTDEEWAEFKRHIQRAELVVVDGVSNGMNLFGYNPLEHKGAVDFEMSFLRPLTAGGAAVVAIDHAPKNTEGVSSSVFGAQHKKAAVTGAMFRFQIVKPFGRGLKGTAALYLEKDKPGFLRQHTEQKGLIAELVLESLSDGTLSARLNTPTIGGERPTRIMESLSQYLENPVRRDQGCTLAELRTKGTYSTNAKWVQKAIEFLLEDGFAQRETNGKIRWRRSYRENAELNPYARPRLPAAPVVPPPPAPVPGQLLEAPQLPMASSGEQGLSIDDDADDIYMSAMQGELL